MTPFLNSSLGAALGWALIHSLWQCLAVGAMAWIGLRMLRSRGSQTRYLLGCGALLMMLTLPVATFLLLWTPLSLGAQGQEGGELTLLLIRSSAVPATSPLTPLLPWLIAAWTAGVAVMSLRLAGGWLWMQRLRWLDAVPVEAHWQRCLGELVQRLAIKRPVRMMKSLAVEVPMVLGWLRPLILVPAAIFTAMEPQALEAILAHELAHVRRHDYLVNLLQSVVEVLLFFHPAVWWLSAQVRAERENCCDDIAVSLCGDPLLYARALAALEEIRPTLESNPSLALAATGGTLMNRIRRILAPKLPPSPAARAGLLAALAVSMLGAASTLGFRQQDPAPKAEPQAERQEIKKIVAIKVDDGTHHPRKLKIEMKGDMKIQPQAKPPVALEEGARLLIEGKDGDRLRSFLAERGAEGEKRTWMLDGKEQAPDPQAEAWLISGLEAAQRFQFREGDTDGLHRTLRLKMPDPKAEKELQARAKLLEEKAKLLAEKRLAKGVSEADIARLQEDVAKQAKEVAAQARKLADRHAREFDPEHIKVIVEKAKADADHARQVAEGARKEHKKIIMLRSGKGGAPLEGEDMHLDLDLDVEDVDMQAPGKEHRIIIRKGDNKEINHDVMVLRSQGDDPKVEIDALKKAIEQMQKRLERLQKETKPAK